MIFTHSYFDIFQSPNSVYYSTICSLKAFGFYLKLNTGIFDFPCYFYGFPLFLFHRWILCILITHFSSFFNISWCYRLWHQDFLRNFLLLCIHSKLIPIHLSPEFIHLLESFLFYISCFHFRYILNQLYFRLYFLFIQFIIFIRLNFFCYCCLFLSMDFMLTFIWF